MEAWWPSGVSSAGAGVKPPGAALAEDRRGERSGKRLGLIGSGGDQEGVPEALGSGLVARGWASLLRRRNPNQMASKPGSTCVPGMSLAAARVAGQAVSGVETARAWSAALARNVRRRALEATVRACGPVRRAARGSVPTADTGGMEYRLRRSLADRLVLAAKPLLAGVVVERRGRLIGDVESINQPGGWEEARKHDKA